MSGLEQRPNEPQPSPRVLNIRFRQFYDHLPYDLVDQSFDSGKETWNLNDPTDIQNIRDSIFNVYTNGFRRFDSEAFDKQTKSLESLLTSAPITPIFREFIVEQYVACYFAGINRHDTENRMYPFLDIDVPESGGIFEATRGKTLEQLAYQKEVDNMLKNIGNFSQLDKGLKGIFDEENQFDEKRLVQWRQEYIERYQDEP